MVKIVTHDMSKSYLLSRPDGRVALAMVSDKGLTCAFIVTPKVIEVLRQQLADAELLLHTEGSA